MQTYQARLDVLANKNLEKLSKLHRGQVLITLTIGGKDLLLAFRKSVSEGEAALTAGIEQLQKRYAEIIDKIQKLFPKATLIATSVYDPTDGTGFLPTSSSLYKGSLPIAYLKQFNEFVKGSAASPIEPGYVGSSEIRRVWLETLVNHI